MTQINSKLSFGSKIYVIGQKKLCHIAKQAGVKEVLESWDIDGVKRAPRCYTTGMFMCSAGGVLDKGKVEFFHFYPKYSLNNIEQLTNDIKARLESVVKSCGKLKGVIVGGENDLWGKYSRESSIESIQLFNVLKRVVKEFKEKGVETDFSIIWGKKEYKTADLYCNAAKDTWIVATRDNIQNHKQLNEYFDIVRISPNDKLILANPKEKK